ncbi:MAG: lysine--tRNA ligase [Chitinophagales bacterium]|nr:lysine--tRNA ligase [Chitinophagales bacterium]
MSEHLSEQEIVRREKLKEFERLGIDPYPAALFEVNCNSKQILSEYNDEQKNFQEVSIAGRLMAIRLMGKAAFAVIEDQHGRIQLYVSRNDLTNGEDATLFDEVVKKLLDIGDFIGVKGFVFKTKTGETTIHVKEFKFLGKSLRPLPIVKETKDEQGNITVHDAFTDPELRYRQRYVDLVVNSGVRETFLKRTKMIQTIRDFLNEHGGIEVDTPVLQNIPGGAAARPFVTHHNALDVPFYLRIANELYLKRLIVGGFDFVYEFSRNFRNEGMDRTHNPEFTVLEYYVAYKDYFWMMDFTEKLFEKIALALHGTTEVKVGDNIISFKAPFKRIGILEAIQEATGEDAGSMNEEQLRSLCKKHRIEVENSMGHGKLIDELFSELCEKKFVQPTFIMDYPVEMSPLTKKHRSKPGLVERFELMINGKELANAYSELNDPIDQRARFEEQVKLMERGDDEAMFIDHDFLRALEYGMPPVSGIGIGIDRLAMLMTNQPSIQEVLFFPQMRPEKAE